VKAHELRQKDEKSLVDELTKFRVTIFLSPLIIVFRKNWLNWELARFPPLPKSSSPV